MPVAPWNPLLESPPPHGHLVQLSGADEDCLTRNVSRYLLEGLKRRDGLVVIATPERRAAIVATLKEMGEQPERAIRDGWLVMLDAEETLARFMVDGQPDRKRFDASVGALVRDFRARANYTGLRAYGEMVGVLWQRGENAAAIRLEEFWNALLKTTDFSLYCGYPIDVFGKDFELGSLDAVLCNHTDLLPAGTNGDVESAINRAMDEILGDRVDEMRQLMKANYRPAWATIPRGEALILWVRNNLPEYADTILARAREYYKAA